ncbi:MAG: DUF2953 domain-containing protein [Ruminococcus sp.]|nr:DUF2953 domain-containing protein [Ruminococcus sp.]
MLALYIILGVLLILFFLTLFNIYIYADYNEQLFLSLKIAFINIQLLPEKEKKKKKKTPEKKQKPKTKKKEPEKKKKEKSFDLKQYVKQKGISGILNIVKRVAKLAVGTLRDLFSHITVTELMIDIKVAGKDAGDSAVKYGQVCTVLFPSLKLITDIVKVNDYNVNVNPDFSNEPKNSAKAKVTAKIRIISILKIVFSKAFAVLRLYLKAKPKKR